MKILNLYANIGGNRKLWGDEHEITAIELDPKIAQIYQDFWPHDKVIVADAHKYLLDHYKEFDFIWSSPHCPTHSKVGRLRTFNIEGTGQYSPAKYPDMALYQEIIFLKHWFKGKWCVENVISYYDPLVPPIESNSHYFWCNFPFPSMPNYVRGIKRKDEEDFAREKVVGFDLSKYKFPTKRHRRTLINNCVEPEVGKHILNCALNKVSLF